MSAKDYPLYRSKKGEWRVFVARLKRFEHDLYDVGVYTSERLAIEECLAARRYLFEQGDPNADEYKPCIVSAALESNRSNRYEYHP